MLANMCHIIDNVLIKMLINICQMGLSNFAILGEKQNLPPLGSKNDWICSVFCRRADLLQNLLHEHLEVLVEAVEAEGEGVALLLEPSGVSGLTESGQAAQG